ncbi:PEST proteolytic signal-containing nuclear protein-like isoform X2 [Chironomus tepperi]|uniref:PEST proteolytic signal-containing nuclear protein-like isoform X2 n=1 Tax=Chironomus tepperi TaxID=113505 RepID=UPI00391FA226
MDRHYKSSSESKKRRSRSPIDRKDDKYHRKHRSKEDYKKRSRSSSSNSSDDERHHKKPTNPPPAPKISMNFNKSSNLVKPTAGIQIKLSTPAKPAPLIQKSTKISNIFNADDDSEPEEMPAEAKMRMRNIGKDTPTSSGPNSFGKTKQGFIDTKKLFERKLKQMADEISND